jgi:hypothetical protein
MGAPVYNVVEFIVLEFVAEPFMLEPFIPEIVMLGDTTGSLLEDVLELDDGFIVVPTALGVGFGNEFRAGVGYGATI